jgi:hypothetical protein
MSLSLLSSALSFLSAAELFFAMNSITSATKGGLIIFDCLRSGLGLRFFASPFLSIAPLTSVCDRCLTRLYTFGRRGCHLLWHGSLLLNKKGRPDIYHVEYWTKL